MFSCFYVILKTSNFLILWHLLPQLNYDVYIFLLNAFYTSCSKLKVSLPSCLSPFVCAQRPQVSLTPPPHTHTVDSPTSACSRPTVPRSHALLFLCCWELLRHTTSHTSVCSLLGRSHNGRASAPKQKVFSGGRRTGGHFTQEPSALHGCNTLRGL